MGFIKAKEHNAAPATLFRAILSEKPLHRTLLCCKAKASQTNNNSNEHLILSLGVTPLKLKTPSFFLNLSHHAFRC